MDYGQLNERKAYLLDEKEEIEKGSKGGLRTAGAIAALAKINAELSVIQRALIAIAGVSAVNTLTEDGYNDEIPPVITLNGDNPQTSELGTTYVDPGATANDAFHGPTDVTASGNVDTSAVGTYTITYTATDLDNNTATATRTVTVVDTTAPVITLNGASSIDVELGASYADAGATASDASGPITVVTSGKLNDQTWFPNIVGAYTVTYTSTDASGNVGTATRTAVSYTHLTLPTKA